MELRFLDGKLQYRMPWDYENPGSGTPWMDVPTVTLSQQEPEPCPNPEPCTEHPRTMPKTAEEWCEHIKWRGDKSVFPWYLDWNTVDESNNNIPRTYMFCAICGTPRPKVKKCKECGREED